MHILNRRDFISSFGAISTGGLVASCSRAKKDRLRLATPERIPSERTPYGPEPDHFGELRLPTKTHGPSPVLIVIHGGYWRAPYRLDLMDAMSDYFSAHGWATWNIEYRRVGNPGGGWPGTLLDVAKACDHVRELTKSHPLNAEHVVTIGHSAGGHLALWLAGRHKISYESELYMENPLPIKAAVALAGVVDLKRAYEQRLGTGAVGELLGGGPTEFPQRFAAASPAELLPLGVPQTLIHGDMDHIVPPGISLGYEKKARKAGDTIVYEELSEAGHFEVIDPGAYQWPPLARCVNRLLSVA